MTERRSTEHPQHRLRGDRQPGQAALHLATRTAAPSMAQNEGREGSRSISLDDDVAQSVETIQRTIETVGSLRDNVHFYKDLAENLRQDLHLEKEQSKQILKRLADMDAIVKAERERTTIAETCAEDFGLVVRDLERQLEKLRSQTVRLVQAVSVLMSTDQHPASIGNQDASRSAA